MTEKRIINPPERAEHVFITPVKKRAAYLEQCLKHIGIKSNQILLDFVLQA